VSDDNAFVEALFRTAKYRPEFPLKGFAELDAARRWAACFVHWYNDEHRHSGIRYVTPGQRHAGQDRRVLAARHAVYQEARERNPRRWSGSTRNWTPVTAVTLNPERDNAMRTALYDLHDCLPAAEFLSFASNRAAHGCGSVGQNRGALAHDPGRLSILWRNRVCLIGWMQTSNASYPGQRPLRTGTSAL
jgi:hypothetical protein